MINKIQFRNVWKRAFNKGFTPNIALKGFGAYVETSILFKVQHKYGVSCVDMEKHLTLLPNLSSFPIICSEWSAAAFGVQSGEVPAQGAHRTQK